MSCGGRWDSGQCRCIAECHARVMFVCRGALSCLFVIQVILCHTGIGTLTLCVSCERCHECAQALSYLCIMREVSHLCVKQELSCFYVILNVSCLCHVLVFFTCYAKSSCLRVMQESPSLCVMQVSHLFITQESSLSPCHAEGVMQLFTTHESACLCSAWEVSYQSAMRVS